MLAGCGSDASQVDASVGDFSVCKDTDGIPYEPGIYVTSRLGAYRATLVSAVTDGPPQVDSPQIGLGTWVVSITDATAGTPADVTMTSDRPWMPKHNHGAPTDPVVTPDPEAKVDQSSVQAGGTIQVDGSGFQPCSIQ